MKVESDVQVDGLKALRKYVVDARRSTVTGVFTHPNGAWENLIKHVIECQEALRAIDEALKDEHAIAAEKAPLAIEDIDRENAAARQQSSLED